MSPLRWGGTAVAIGLAACASRRSDTAYELSAQRIQRSVAELRGLPERHPTPVQVVEERAFARLLAERADGASAEGAAGGSEIGGAAAVARSEEQAVHIEETLGFYDIPGKSIYLRAPSGADRDRLPLAWVLVHELTHALQHQNLPIRDISTLETADEQLAYLALIEGDAMVTMLAHGARENFVPIDRAVLLAMRNLARGEADRLAQFGAPPDKLDSVSPIVRERMVFPYSAGTAFVSAIHRTGGFELVNQVYERPPRTTEQVLHPEKYIAGEAAVELDTPVVPTGFALTAKGRMGELGIDGMLQACVRRDYARAAAAGWGGDAFVISTAPNGNSLVLWHTIWDSPTDADEFAQSVSRCSDASGHGQVVRQGDRVSVVAGNHVSNAAAIHEYMFKLGVRRRPASPPLRITRLRAVPPVPDVPAATLSGDRYDNPRLDVAMPVPPGFRASLVDGALVLENDDALMEVDFSPAVVTTASTAKVYRDFMRAVDARPGTLTVLSNDHAQTPIGKGLERTWELPGTRLRLQVLVVPVCNGNGSVVFRRLWSDRHSGRLLDWVLQSTRRIVGGVPPVCAEL